MNQKSNLQIIGPYASEYSLARVNRAFANSLAKVQNNFQVSVWGNEYFLDKSADNSDLIKYPELQELISKEQSKDIAIFNSFPKSPDLPYGLKNITAKVRLAYLAWEETIFPKHFVDECNKYLHGIMTTSNYVLKVLRNSGIKLPMVNIKEGLYLVEKSSYKLQTDKKFKFLHLSSGHYRKGVDVLLKAYFAEFTATDNVVLILKVFPNPNNEIPELLKELQNINSPAVEIIEDATLNDSQIASLYDQADVVVAPSRAEGFGLPIGEAMLAKKPVITTGFSGQLDFCNNSNCYLLDYTLVNSKSHLGTLGAKVADPSLEHLRELLRRAYSEKGSAAQNDKVEKAFAEVSKLTWESTARKAIEFIELTSKTAELKEKKMVVVTPYNSAGGLEEYSKNFYRNIESSFSEFVFLANKDLGARTYKEASNVIRTWEMVESNPQNFLNKILELRPNFVHFQYNPPLYSLLILSQVVTELVKNDIKVFITLHSVQVDYIDFAEYADILNKCTKIFVHSKADQKFLINKGLKNTELFAHGILDFPDADKYKLRQKMGLQSKHILATHGLIHDKKGLLETIQAVALLKEKFTDIVYLAVNALNPDNTSSAGVYTEMKKLIAELDLTNNVYLISDFIQSSEVIKLLQLADIILLPYPELKESASGAVRQAMASLRPIIITNSHIFSDLVIGYRIPDNSPQTISQAAVELFTNPELYDKETQNIKTYVEKYSWENISKEYLYRLSSLV